MGLYYVKIVILRSAESDRHAVWGKAEPSAVVRENHIFPERLISRGELRILPALW